MGLALQVNRLRQTLGNWIAYGGMPGQDRVYRRTPRLDDYRAYVADTMTFAKLKTLVRAADNGDVATLLALFEEMEGRDLRLHGLASTRRNALTGLDWEVVSAADTQGKRIDKSAADEAAAYVEATLQDLDGFDVALEHLATAIGPNLAVAELLWSGFELQEIRAIPAHRLMMNPQDMGELRILTEEHYDGKPLTPGKWIVHSPHARAGGMFRCTISQAQAMIYLWKFLALANWGSYVEVFGQPVRWGKYANNASENAKAEALDMLKNMGSSAYGLFSDAVELSMVESSQRGISPHEAMIEFCNREMAIAWLGGTLTADTTGATGTLAGAKVHNEVRADLLQDDVRRESRTIRRDLIRPLVAYRFGGRDMPLPEFRRVFKENIDRKLEGEVMEIAQRVGIAVPRDWAYERLSIPPLEAGDEALEPSIGSFGGSLNEGF